MATVFNDFAPILIILAVILLIYGYSWRLAPGLTSGGLPEGEMDFYDSLLNAINLIFGNAPDPLGGDGQQRFAVIVFIIYCIGNITLALVLLNFLIALISGTAARVSDNKELNDCRELLPLIQDFDLFLKWRRGDDSYDEVNMGERFVMLVDWIEID